MGKPKRLVHNAEVAGIAVHYARQPVARYGTRGKPRRPRCTPEFRGKLVACMEEFANVCPLGKPEIFVTAGMYVDRKNARPGDTHVAGEAVDVDAFWWGDGIRPLITGNALTDAGRYLGTEALLRMHFGVVIDYWCNASHRDHWHIDDGGGVGFSRRSKSEVAFVQAACLYVHGQDPGKLDRTWGPKTAAAVARVMEPGWTVTNKQGWQEFLRRTFRAGWNVCEDPWAGRND